MAVRLLFPFALRRGACNALKHGMDAAPQSTTNLDPIPNEF
jgi:hypothetical protein